MSAMAKSIPLAGLRSYAPGACVPRAASQWLSGRRPASSLSTVPLSLQQRTCLPRSGCAAPTTTLGRRFCAAPEQREFWDLTQDNKIEFKFTDEDLKRFPSEREMFRKDPRLQPGTLLVPPGGEDMDALATAKALSAVLRLADYFMPPFQYLCYDRLTENEPLVTHLGIPPMEEKIPVYIPDHHRVPGADVYQKVRKQAYWLALHIWLIHDKQYQVQAGEGLFGSAICALITRRLFEWQWNQFRGWMHDEHVPVMSITSELQDLQEFVFGFCLALDTAYREEALDGMGTLAALAIDENALPAGRHGLAPRIKHALWANVYSGVEPPDSKELYELTAYLLRQRAALEIVPRGAFLSGEFAWADFSF